MLRLVTNKIIYILIIAVFYVILGKLAMALATPGGYATAIFPPSGLALVAILMLGRTIWPGVWLGSLALNLWIGSTPENWFSETSILVAAGIATGSLLQAIMGARLAGREGREGALLLSSSDVFRFLTMGGPIACLAAASMGTFVLYLSHTISTDKIFMTWFTWWIGDTIGVLIFAPMVLMYWPREGQLGGKARLKVVLPVFSAIAIVTVMVSKVDQGQKTRLKELFDRQAKESLRPYLAEIHHYEGALNSLATYVESTPNLDPEAFRRFVKGIYGITPVFRALSWCPRVEAAKLAQFETSQTLSLGASFRITESGPDRVQRPVGRRHHYYPITFIEPMSLNRGALGFDLASEPIRSQFIARVADRKGVVASQPIEPVQFPGEGKAILLGQSVRGPDGEVRGVVTAVVMLASLTHPLSTEAKRLNLAACLMDVSGKDSQGQILAWTTPVNPKGSRDLTSTISVPWAGRTYAASFLPTDVFLAQINPWQTWALLASGLLLASMLEAALLASATLQPR